MMTNTAARELRNEQVVENKRVKKKRKIKVMEKAQGKSYTKQGITTMQKVTFSVVVLIVLALIVVTVMRYTTMSELNRELSSKDRNIRDLTTQRDYMAIELEPYIANKRIELEAKELGMVYPDDEKIFVLDNIKETMVADESSN